MSFPSTIDAGTYLTVDSPREVARWRPLAQWVLYIPHAIILHAFRALAGAVFIVYWFGLLFTGRLNGGLYKMMTVYERYNARATGFLIGWSEQSAPFDFHPGGADNGAYGPIELTLPEGPPETASRRDLWNVVLAIPHYLMLVVYGLFAVVAAIGAWFAVLFTGRWPGGLRRFVVRVANYYHRLWTYVTMVEPGYPSFRLPA